jgi:formylglycine-generating enzyme required for sulfatase activity
VTFGQFQEFVLNTGYQTEWCADEIPGDPPKRILRGGSYNTNVQTCRCSARGFGKPWSRYSYTGFRIVVGP